MTADSWQEYLEGLAVFGMRPGLERVAALLQMLGDPQKAFRCIHVVGTNGKSSTTRYCEAILRRHGYRSGAYLSPHLSGWNERVLVDGAPIDWTLLGACIERLRDLTAKLPASAGAATQFEVLTVAALFALAESGVEAVALEAGLGGRLDATNVVEAPVVALTNIAVEHATVLGATRELIFAEKAAVIKGGAAAFGPLDGLDRLAREACARAGARAHLRDSEYVIDGDVSNFSVELLTTGERWQHLSAATIATYQVENAALAVVASRLFAGRLDEAAVRAALVATRVAGRLQPVSEHPLVLFDGAHNVAGTQALVDSLAALELVAPRIGVLAIMADKSYDEMLRLLVPALDGVICTQTRGERCLPAERLAERLRALAPVGFVRAVERDPIRALAAARTAATPAGSVLVSGSLYLLEELSDPTAAQLYLRETGEAQ